MAEEKHQPASAEGASADGNSICEDAAVDSVNGDTASSTSEGVKPGESASTAPGSAAVGPGKGADYPLGSLEVWAARWGALRLVCRRVAAVPHHHHVSAGLALHAQQALSASDKVIRHRSMRSSLFLIKKVARHIRWCEFAEGLKFARSAAAAP